MAGQRQQPQRRHLCGKGLRDTGADLLVTVNGAVVGGDSPQVCFSSCLPEEGMTGMEREGCASSTASDVAGSIRAQVGSGLPTTDSWLRRGAKFLACITANKSKSQ